MIGSGASELPSAYGLGGSSTRIELRIASTRASTAAAASCAAAGDSRLAADAPRNSPNCSGVNSWSAVMPTLLVDDRAAQVREGARRRRRACRPPPRAPRPRPPAGRAAPAWGRRCRPAASASRVGVTCPAVTSAPTASSRARAPAPSVPHWCGGATTTGPSAARAERHRAEEVLRGQRAAVARERLGGGRGAGPGRHRRGRGCGGGAGEERVGEQRGDRPSGERHHATADAPADGVRGEQHRPRAGGLHDVEGRVVEHAVGGPGDVGGHGGLQQRRQDLPPWASAPRGRVDEPAAAEGHEVRVGVGQRDHAPALRHGRKLGEPLPGHRGTGARDRRPAPPDDLVALAHHGGGLDEVGVDRQAEPRAHRRPDGRALRERGDHAAEPSGGGEGGGEGVVVEQRRRPRHGGDAVRRLGDRVEHGDRRRVGGQPGGRRAGQAEHRQQHADGGEAGPVAARGGAVHVDEQLVHAGGAEREAGSAQRHGEATPVAVRRAPARRRGPRTGRRRSRWARRRRARRGAVLPW